MNGNEAMEKYMVTIKGRRRNDDELVAAKERRLNLSTRMRAMRIWRGVVIEAKKVLQQIEKKNMATDTRKGMRFLKLIATVGGHTKIPDQDQTASLQL